MNSTDRAAFHDRSPIAQQIQDNLRHMRILASAGSGKTYQLTNRYLRLIRAGAPPETILASTFTRLAAGEIRDRVLTALAELAEDRQKREQLTEDLGGPIERDEAIDMLVTLTRQLHRLQVRTLDSFFSSIVRAFSLELGIDPAAEIADEHILDELRQQAIRQTLEASDEGDAKRLRNTLSALIDDTAERSVTDSIEQTVRSLYDLYLEASPRAWEVEPAPGLLDDAGYTEAMRAMEALAVQAEQRAKRKGDLFAHKTTLQGFRDDMEFLRGANLGSLTAWKTFTESGIARKIINGDLALQSRPITEDVQAAYAPFVQHFRALARKIIVDRTRATHDLIERYHAHFQSLKQQRKAMSFIDLTHALAGAQKLDSEAWGLDEIYFRLDATLRHLLLDEMQDTSIAQWRAMHPIVAGVLSNAPPDYSFFAVGDVKQSIYGWRGAVPAILESLPEQVFVYGGEQSLETPTLETSHRSSIKVIDAVNKLFMSIGTNPKLEKHPEAAKSWQATFTEHRTAKKNLLGHVTLRTVAEAEPGQSNHDVRLRETAELVTELYEQCRHTDITIGVLTRTNKAAAHLLHELRGMDVPASVRGGGALTDAPAVNAILDLFRLADHPNHSVAAFNVMHSPLGEAIGMPDLGDRCANRRRWRGVSRRVRRTVMERGYAAMIAEWISMIASQVDARQRRRLILLQDKAVHYDRRPTLRCDDFVTYIESLDVADPFASPVQVMTVHQSKGLQFDAVILPDLDKPLCNMQKQNVLIERDGPVGSIMHIARHVNKHTTEMFDDLNTMYVHHEREQVRESLSLLYVAMTRAKHALHMLIDPPKKLKNGGYSATVTHAAVVREGLGEEDPEPETLLYARGDSEWMKHHPRQTGTRREDEDEEVQIALARASGDVPRGRTGLAASSLHEPEQEPADEEEQVMRPLREAFMLPHVAARDRGSVMHAMFECIEWIDEGMPHEADLRAVVQRIAPRRDATWADQQVSDFFAIAEQAAVRAALSRPVESEGEGRIYPEFPYARLVDGTIQRGFIDRLVVIQRDGTPIAAHILDFKTDDIPAARLAERAERYRRQLETYQAVVREVFGLEDRAISLQLLFVMPGELVSLS